MRFDYSFNYSIRLFEFDSIIRFKTGSDFLVNQIFFFIKTFENRFF